MVPSPLGALCPRNDAGGILVRDSIPTGYKWGCGECRIAKRAPPWIQLTKPNQNFNAERGSTGQRSERIYICKRNGRTPLWLGARLRRQPLAPSGATLRAPGVDRSARPSKGGLPCQQCRTALAQALETEGRKKK